MSVIGPTWVENGLKKGGVERTKTDERFALEHDCRRITSIRIKRISDDIVSWFCCIHFLRLVCDCGNDYPKNLWGEEQEPRWLVGGPNIPRGPIALSRD